MQELLKHFIDAWSSPSDYWEPSKVIDKIELMIEKEKDQIIDAFDYGYHCASNGTGAEITLTGDIFYKEIYNQNK